MEMYMLMNLCVLPDRGNYEGFASSLFDRFPAEDADHMFVYVSLFKSTDEAMWISKPPL